MAKHLRAEAEFIRGRRGARQVLKPAAAIKGPPGSKRAEAVARELFGEVITGKLAPGHLLGSEGELMERYGVSRAVLREAVRILEHHHIAAMWRGRGGGLFVSAPSVAAVTDVVALYLERHGAEPARLAEVRVGVELATVDLVIERGGADLPEVLQRALAAESRASDDELGDSEQHLHAVLAALSGNRALELIARILIRLSRQASGAVGPESRAQLLQAHVGIVEAVIDRDRELARHRVLGHHVAMVPQFR
jgi:DNA-binding FadR family transcriptional regulator